ncbi:GtrA family protein [Thauera aromatica]|uniref:GtrA family protein n=1 Tax=Thauera aromatica TaxID=59405 RepID=UPI001FFC3772|nr:GtrA family protein [Thauera aromatica]MCK2097706.1 GtrA family protein [Thauera aromatica]
MEQASKTDRRSKLLSELFLAARFGLIGTLSTVFHIAIVLTLLATTAFPALIANAIAFAIAFAISFTGNYLWTFSTHGPIKMAAFRFLIISACAFIFNSAILSATLLHFHADPAFSAACAAAVTPVITFIASRLWCFN